MGLDQIIAAVGAAQRQVDHVCVGAQAEWASEVTGPLGDLSVTYCNGLGEAVKEHHTLALDLSAYKRRVARSAAAGDVDPHLSEPALVHSGRCARQCTNSPTWGCANEAANVSPSARVLKCRQPQPGASAASQPRMVPTRKQCPHESSAHAPVASRCHACKRAADTATRLRAPARNPTPCTRQSRPRGFYH